MRILLTPLTIALLTHAVPAFADGGHESGFIDSFLKLDLMAVALWSFALLAIVIGLAAVTKPKSEKVKRGFFFTIAAISLAVTAVFIAQTTIKNVLSETKGPVHWHADFRIVTCGNELDLLDPEGLLNRIGTPSVHEHNDKRIHVEGTMMKVSDASLGSFFEKIDGELSNSTLRLPTNDGVVEYNDGDTCGDGRGSVQVFVWTVEDGRTSQRKLYNHAEYVMSPHSAIPPGDCVIIEFDKRKARTELLCEQYVVAAENDELVVDDPNLNF